MFIEQYAVIVKDIHSKKNKKYKIDANTAVDAHYKALSYCNELNQEIIKISDASSNTVYTLTNGFNDE